MVLSSNLTPPPVDTKGSRKDSNASSSGAYSAEFSRCSIGYDEPSADSLDALASALPSAHYIIKCNLNRTTSSTPTPSPPSSVLLTPRVQVTVEQSSTESLLKTPQSPNLPIQKPNFIMANTSTASSAPEFSLSATSSLDDSDEIALYEQYLSISHGRQSNPSPEIRKKLFDDRSTLQIRVLPRSKSEVHTGPIEQIPASPSQSSQYPHQQQQLTVAATLTSAIAPVTKSSEVKSVRRTCSLVFIDKMYQIDYICQLPSETSLSHVWMCVDVLALFPDLRAFFI